MCAASLDVFLYHTHTFAAILGMLLASVSLRQISFPALSGMQGRPRVTSTPQRSDNFVLNLDWAHHNYGEFDESRHFTPHPAISRHFTPFFINLLFSLVFSTLIFVGLNTPFPAILKTVPPFCVWLLGWCSSVALQLNS